MNPVPNHVKNLLNQRFDRLLVTDFAYIKGDANGEHKTAYWKCQCDCGNEIIVKGSDLMRGSVTSCGCKTKERITEYNTTHGLRFTRLHRLYQNMLTRCYNPKYNKYDRYGGRGIKVCKRWYDPDKTPEERKRLGNPEFINFYNDAYKLGYFDQPEDTPLSELLSLDRINVDGDYCPENCRFIPYGDQAYNRGNNKFITDITGEQIVHSKFEDKYNLHRGTISNFIKHGWSENAILYAATHPELNIRMAHPIITKHTEFLTRTQDHPNVYIRGDDGSELLIPTVVKQIADYKKAQKRKGE